MSAIHEVSAVSKTGHFSGMSVTNNPAFQEAIGVSRLDPSDPDEAFMRGLALGHHARMEAHRNMTAMSLGKPMS